MEYGTEDENRFDIHAIADGKKLIGEAFNVAPSFFQTKKGAMLKKLRQPEVIADYKIIMFNHDAVKKSYKPNPKRNEFFVFVKVGADSCCIVPDERLHPAASNVDGW